MEANKELNELGDIIVALDMDGPTYIPWTDPEQLWDHIPDTLHTLVNEGINGKRVSVICASFNPSMHQAHKRSNIAHFFFAGRYGANHDWISEETEYSQSFREGLKKSEQLRNMLGERALQEKLVIFIDDHMKNCEEVQKELGISCIHIPNTITSSTPHRESDGVSHRGFTIDMIREVVELMGERKKINFIFHYPM